MKPLSPSKTIHMDIKKKLNFLCSAILLKNVSPQEFSFSLCCMYLAIIMTGKTDISSFVATIIIKHINKYSSVNHCKTERGRERQREV